MDGNEDLVTEKTDALMIESLFMTLTNVNFDDSRIQAQIDRVHREQGRMIPRCAVCASPCGRNEDYNMEQLWQAEENIRSLKSLLLFGLRGMAAYAYHAMVLGYTDNTVNQFFYEALMQIGLDLTMEELLPEVLKLGEVNLGSEMCTRDRHCWIVPTRKPTAHRSRPRYPCRSMPDRLL